MKKALVCGAGGFVGSHLVKRLKGDGYWVRGADLVPTRFSQSAADEFLIVDLREARDCARALAVEGGFEDVYQLAADMGGQGFISLAECEVMRNNALINANMIHGAVNAQVTRYFFSSSVCIYRNMFSEEPALSEDEAYPAFPDNEYGWEKLFAERVAAAYSRRYGLTVRIARFHNCYGPENTWSGGREKAPAAICRKVAEAADGGSIEVWGDGTAARSFIFIDDLVDGIVRLMATDLEGPVNIGVTQSTTIRELVDTVARVAAKPISIRYVDGPVGVMAGNFSNARISSTGWRPKYVLEDGIKRTYPWIDEQVRAEALRRPVRQGIAMA